MAPDDEIPPWPVPADLVDVVDALRAAAGADLVDVMFVGRAGPPDNNVLISADRVADRHLVAARDTNGRAWIVALDEDTHLERDGQVYPLDGTPTEVFPNDLIWAGTFDFHP